MVAVRLYSMMERCALSRCAARRTAKAVHSIMPTNREIRQAFSIPQEKGFKAIGKWFSNMWNSPAGLRLRTSKGYQKFINSRPIRFIRRDISNCGESIQKGIHAAKKEKNIFKQGATVVEHLDLKNNPQYLTTLVGTFTPVPLGGPVGYVLGLAPKIIAKLVQRLV